MKSRLAAALPSLLIAALLAFVAAVADAQAQSHVIVDSGRATYPLGLSTKETLACASPCSVAASNVVLMNANNTRSTAVICNAGTATVYVCLSATTCAGSGAYEVALKAATASNDGSGGCVTLGGQTGRLWQGGVTLSSSGSSVSAFAY